MPVEDIEASENT